MRFIHTGDWHVGKRVHGYDLLADQEAIFQQIIQLAKTHQADAIVIAGDLYDRAVPNQESVALLNAALQQMNLTEKFPLLVISGNHDSAVRLATGSAWFSAQQFYLQTTVSQALTPVEMFDVQFYLLPYFEIFDVQQVFPNIEIKTLQQAFDLVVETMAKSFDPSKKHILVSHFFASGATPTDSETKIQVGGLQNITTTSLEIFDYVALGHLHNPKALNHPSIRYSGSPLPFSISEANQQKGVVLVDTEKMTQEFLPLTPPRKIHLLTASFEELTTDENYLQYKNDFVAIKLTDQAVIYNVMARLNEHYSFILELTRANAPQMKLEKKVLLAKSPLDLFEDFYQTMTEKKVNDSQRKILEKSFQEIGKGELL